MRKIMVPVCAVNRIRIELLCKSVDACAKKYRAAKREIAAAGYVPM
jgi:hypothetical protein